MQNTSPTNLIELANLKNKVISSTSSVPWMNDFFSQYQIGQSGNGFLGFKLENNIGSLKNIWYCLSAEDRDKGRHLWNPPPESEEFQAELKHRDITPEALQLELDSMFVNLFEQPHLSEVRERILFLSVEARKFLQKFMPEFHDKSPRQESQFPNEIFEDLTQSDSIMHFMDKKLKKVTKTSNCFRIRQSQKGPTVIFEPYYARFVTLENEVYAKLYLAPYLDGAEEVWQRTRICQECGNFFLYKQERAKYCSQRCRMTVANRERRNK